MKRVRIPIDLTFSSVEDMRGNINAQRRAIDGKRLAHDDVTLNSTLSILYGIEHALFNMEKETTNDND